MYVHPPDCGCVFCYGSYVFPNNPVAKSSTSVMQASVCQKCGCKLDGQPLNKKCECKCHIAGAR